MAASNRGECKKPHTHGGRVRAMDEKVEGVNGLAGGCLVTL